MTPSITDYEHQTPKRYAELYVKLIHDRPLKKLSDFIYPHRIPKNVQLLNLLATRYVIDDSTKQESNWPRGPAFRLLWHRGRLRVYENVDALPRAFYVPQVEIVRDREELLERVSSPSHNPRRVALIEKAPAGEGLGTWDGSGEVTISEDRAENLVIRVQASREGFLFLSDQYYPGWQATVNGVRTEIYRANYAFRLVRVPKGEATVVFSYRPRSLRVGALISLATVAALVLYAGAGYLRRRASA